MWWSSVSIVWSMMCLGIWCRCFLRVVRYLRVGLFSEVGMFMLSILFTMMLVPNELGGLMMESDRGLVTIISVQLWWSYVSRRFVRSSRRSNALGVWIVMVVTLFVLVVSFSSRSMWSRRLSWWDQVMFRNDQVLGSVKVSIILC